jgi:hypothetical protein
VNIPVDMGYQPQLLPKGIVIKTFNLSRSNDIFINEERSPVMTLHAIRVNRQDAVV